MIKAVVFDFFGVLAGDGFDATYRKAGGDPVKDQRFIRVLLDQTNRGLITTDQFRQRICKQLGITVGEYQESLRDAEQINHDLLAYIKGLRPKYKTAILSNVNRGGLERRIDKKALDELFDVIVVSGEVGYIKPEHEIYEITAQRLAARPEECVFTDDRKGYLQAAEAVGMKTIWYQTFAQFKVEFEKLLAIN